MSVKKVLAIVGAVTAVAVPALVIGAYAGISYMMSSEYDFDRNLSYMGEGDFE